MLCSLRTPCIGIEENKIRALAYGTCYFRGGGGGGGHTHILPQSLIHARMIESQPVLKISLNGGRSGGALLFLGGGGGVGPSLKISRILPEICPNIAPNLAELDTLAFFLGGGGGGVVPLPPSHTPMYKKHCFVLCIYFQSTSLYIPKRMPHLNLTKIFKFSAVSSKPCTVTVAPP